MKYWWSEILRHMIGVWLCCVESIFPVSFLCYIRFLMLAICGSNFGQFSGNWSKIQVTGGALSTTQLHKITATLHIFVMLQKQRLSKYKIRQGWYLHPQCLLWMEVSVCSIYVFKVSFWLGEATASPPVTSVLQTTRNCATRIVFVSEPKWENFKKQDGTFFLN